MQTKFFLSLAVWVSLTNLSLQAQSLFSDSFDEDRSADWIIYDDSVDGVSDATYNSRMIILKISLRLPWGEKPNILGPQESLRPVLHRLTKDSKFR